MAIKATMAARGKKAGEDVPWESNESATPDTDVVESGTT
jgi:hypothetical protein